MYLWRQQKSENNKKASREEWEVATVQHGTVSPGHPPTCLLIKVVLFTQWCYARKLAVTSLGHLIGTFYTYSSSRWCRKKVHVGDGFSEAAATSTTMWSHIIWYKVKERLIYEHMDCWINWQWHSSFCVPSQKCDEIIVLHLGYLNYTQYQVMVSFKGLENITFEIKVKFVVSGKNCEDLSSSLK